MLINEGLSIYEAIYSPKRKRIVIACDGGLLMIFEVENFNKVGQVSM